MEGATEYWNKSDNIITDMSKRTDLFRPVEFGERDPRHVLQMEDAVLQKQYPAANWSVDAIAPCGQCSF